MRHAYERLPTGQAVTSSDVKTLLLHPSPNANFQSFYEVCQLVFLIVIVVCFIAEMVKFIRQKRYLRQVRNWVELLLLFVSVVAVAMSFLKGKYTSLYVKKVQKNPYETFSPDYIVKWAEQETMWLAAAIFILTLKLLRLIRFNHHICQMQGTLKRSARPFISFVLVFGVGIMAFTYFGCIAFGTHTDIFSSLFNSFKTNVLMSIGKQINYVEIYINNSQIEPLFLFFYFLFVICILINVFIAVITDSYSGIREDQGHAFDDAKLGTFMFAKFSKKVHQLPGKITSSVKQLSKLRCTDLLLGNNTYKFKPKRDRRRRQAELEANFGIESENCELVPPREHAHFSEIFQGGSKTISHDTDTRMADIHDAIDDYYLHEIRKQLLDARKELSRYHPLIGRDSRASSVLHHE